MTLALVESYAGSETIDTCGECGASLQKHEHRLSGVLAKGIEAIYNAREARIADLDLNYSERANFQKLKYWGITEKTGYGRARITEQGIAFVEGLCALPRTVTTFRGEVVGADMDDLTFFEDIA